MSLKAKRGVAVAFLMGTSLVGSEALALNKQECIQASERGQQLRDEGKIADAKQQFLICVQEACPRPVADACREDLSAVEKRLPTLVLSARSAAGADLVDVTVQIDGTTVTQKLDGRAVPINPGPHKLRFEANGQTVEEQIVIIEGEKSRSVRVSFPGAGGEGTKQDVGSGTKTTEAPTSGGGIHPATFVFGGLAVVSLGAFGFFALKGTGDISDLKDTCGKTQSCKQDDVDAAKSKLLVGDIFLAVGIVSAGAATYFALSPRSNTSSVSVGVRGPGLELRGKF